MTDDNDSTLAELQIDRQRTLGGGASIVQSNDPRVSKLFAWALGFLGTAIATGSFMAANNLYQLNLTVAQGVKNDAAQMARIDDHEIRLRAVERDVSAIEGKVFRGVDGFGENKHAPR